MKDFLWFICVGTYIALIYIVILQISWTIFSFVSDVRLHSLLTIFGAYIFHTKLIFKGEL